MVNSVYANFLDRSRSIRAIGFFYIDSNATDHVNFVRASDLEICIKRIEGHFNNKDRACIQVVVVPVAPV